MKWMVAILSMYLLGLNLIPCGDDAIEHDSVENTCNQEPQEHDDDLCSPFCCCSCCSIPALDLDTANLEWTPVSIEINLHSMYYKNPFWDQFNGWILQPPQLASA
ncbi:MAG: DUF6660 family protein [Nonlabens sp.]